MFVPQVFEMLQDSFQQHHSKFNFPNKQLEHSSPKFQAAMGEFTIRLNDKIRNDVMDQIGKIETNYNTSLKKCEKELISLGAQKIFLAAALGVSVSLNIAALLFIF